MGLSRPIKKDVVNIGDIMGLSRPTKHAVNIGDIVRVSGGRPIKGAVNIGDIIVGLITLLATTYSRYVPS